VPRRSPAPKAPLTLEDYADLRRRCEAGDVEAFRQITHIDHEDDDLDIDEGDIAAHAERAVVELTSTSIRERAALARRLAQKRTELDGPTPSPIEQVLVDRVVTCGLHVSVLEERFTKAIKEEDVTLQKHLDRLLTSAHRRHLLAVNMLARVRRLVIPVVQLNMANQQVNLVVASNTDALPA
jgi:hypothetical protein